MNGFYVFAAVGALYWNVAVSAMVTPAYTRAINGIQFLVVLAIIVLVPVALVLALALAFPITGIMLILIEIGCTGLAVHNHRKRKAAKAFRCLQCGQLLGAKSVRLADEEFRKHLRETRKKSSFARFRIVKTCHAICATCGLRYEYRAKERTFVTETGTERRGARVAR